MLIGIASRKTLKNNKKIYFIKDSYLLMLRHYGLSFLMLTKENFSQVVSYLDGILIPGGDDINPIKYNQKNKCSKMIDNEIDDLDFMCVEYAEKHKLPLLGICRGIQVINVYFEGTLKQNIYKHNKRYHILNVKEKRYLKYDEYLVNSYHHQSIDKLGKKLITIASSKNIIEIVIHQDLPILGVQFHPELSNDNLTEEIINLFINYKGDYNAR